MTDALVPPIALEPAAAPPAQALPARGSGAVPFRFTGAAREYFGIWIVNLLLTLLTLGLYSPWAKVRRKRYFYGNTWLAGSNFEYHGNPVAILKGRLIAFGAFAAYTGVAHYWPRMGAAVILGLMPAVPWLIVRSFAFNAVNSSYRNLRFHFDGRYREALAAIWPFALVPAATLLLPQLDRAHPPKSLAEMWFLFIPMIVAGAVYPSVIGRVKRLHADRSRFGTARMHCTARTRSFYGIYAIATLILIGAGFVVALAVGVVVAFAMMALGSRGAMTSALISALPVIYVALGSLVLGYTRSRVTNLVFNATSLEGGWRFTSTLKARRLCLLYATNLVAIVVSLGMLMPWAAIRVARYRASCLALEGEGALDHFLADATRHVAATGEEVGEMFDVDLSL